ncbi:MAG: hypothetical protein JWP34_4817, partial [Massilia sp.]|nr:hypothetical protein [Massilia sp.]
MGLLAYSPFLSARQAKRSSLPPLLPPRLRV